MVGSSDSGSNLRMAQLQVQDHVMLATHNEKHPTSYTASWILWPASHKHVAPLPRSIDHALSEYVFYPELEWAQFGYRPPDNFPLLGSWRDRGGQVFAFLLDRTTLEGPSREKQALLYVSGMQDAVETLGARVTALKSELAKSERKELSARQADHRIEQEKRSPAVARLLKLIGLFAVVVNAFSLYLRKLPAPILPSTALQELYESLVVVVHIAALVLLLTITLIGIGYVLRYGLLMLRRL